MQAEGEGVVTPFEKNLEVWRQLWRVLERSDAILQIVDGRDPLFYLNDDLRKLVQDEMKKKMVVVVNKSDFLSTMQRKKWKECLEGRGYTDIYFYSAKQEQDREIDLPYEEEREASILTRSQLLSKLQALRKEEGKMTLGTVGFPNVGKSSLINSLLPLSTETSKVQQRVAVAAQPGKTKHFQTLLLTDTITLCDCPGLVFPSMVNSRADLVANGVYPISQMRLDDYWSVLALMVPRIPVRIWNGLYGLKFVEGMSPSRERLIMAFCQRRSLWSGQGGGNPDVTGAGRLLVKDYVAGNLLYCKPPPGIEDELSWNLETVSTNVDASKKLSEKKRLHENQQMHEKLPALLPSADADVDDMLLDMLPAEEKPKKQPKGKPWKKQFKPQKTKKKKKKNDRDEDPYGCHFDESLGGTPAANNSGVSVNAGKYGATGYTRPNHAGAKSAVAH